MARRVRGLLDDYKRRADLAVPASAELVGDLERLD